MGIFTREDVLNKAVHDCMKEMYAKSQPSADYDQLLKDYEEGRIGKDERIYERYYLSHDEFLYIKDKYKEAYRINNEWISNIGVLEEYLNKGGTKDKYIEECTDENGMKHPGHRGYEKVLPLKEQIEKIMREFDCSECAKEVAHEIYDTVMETIKNCKEFYKFDRENNEFEFAICLGASPTSNKEGVKKWWKENKGIDIEIVDRNPLLFWEYEYYGDELEEIMKDEYGNDWKEYWDKKWKKKEEEKKKEYERKISELKQMMANEEEFQ